MIKPQNNRAFTIVELIVCVGIIAAVSGVAFWNGRKFNDKLLVTAVAQDVSLAIRQTQSYGTTVREKSVGSGQFGSSYGVFFSTANPSFAIIFTDTNSNGLYDGGVACSGSDECVEKVALRNGVTVTSFCGIDSFGSTNCSGAYRSVQALFTRPSLDAVVTIINTSGSIVSGPWNTGQVVLSSPRGVNKTISISTTGQIVIQ